ncbi:MAG: 23S rRNA (pseudouridine(1915)-N(3))-methyltransferase RlmH [Solirubrobacterales bacterium]
MKRLRFQVLSVGRIKEGYLKEGIQEYLKRLRPYVAVELAEGLEEKTPPNPSDATIEAVIEKEGQRILERLKDGDYVVALDSRGKALTSEQLAGFLEARMNASIGRIVWIIGGSHGLSQAVLDRADYTLSLSNLTFLHQMTGMILLEQLYRGFKIIRGEPYHK